MAVIAAPGFSVRSMARWRTLGIPRTADGKPNLTAPAPSPRGRNDQMMSGANVSPRGRNDQTMSGANVSPRGRNDQTMNAMRIVTAACVLLIGGPLFAQEWN